jgi:hypothetical protein
MKKIVQLALLISLASAATSYCYELPYFITVISNWYENNRQKQEIQKVKAIENQYLEDNKRFFDNGSLTFDVKNPEKLWRATKQYNEDHLKYARAFLKDAMRKAENNADTLTQEKYRTKIIPELEKSIQEQENNIKLLEKYNPSTSS